MCVSEVGSHLLRGDLMYNEFERREGRVYRFGCMDSLKDEISQRRRFLNSILLWDEADGDGSYLRHWPVGSHALLPCA